MIKFNLQMNSSSFNFSHLPKFLLSGHQINVLEKPSDFYDALLQQTKLAKHRIIIASLYIGKGKMEDRLVWLLLFKISLNLFLLFNLTLGSRNSR